MSDHQDTSSGGHDDAPGLIPDEDLPEDLQPTDDNPLAKDPEDADGDSDAQRDAGPGGSVDGLPDMGEPGAPGAPS